MAKHTDEILRVSRRRAVQVGSIGAGAALLSQSSLPMRAAALSQDAGSTPDASNPDFTNPFGIAEQQGGTYTLAGVATASGTPRMFVPTSYYGSLAFFVCKLMYTPLVTLDWDWTNLGPAIASSWEWSEDNLHLSMNLRDDVLFHDGQPVTAEDVAFTYRLMVRSDPFPAVQDITVFEGGAEYKDGSTDDFAGVEIVNEHTVRFNLSSAANTFLLNLSNCGILPVHAFGTGEIDPAVPIDELPFFAGEGGPPIGSGPWKIDEYNPDTNLSFAAHTDYYKGAPVLDSIILRLGIAGPAGLAGIQAGEFDGLFVGASYPDARELESNEQLELVANYSMANEQVLITATEKPYLDVKFRQALLTAVDKQALIDTISFGYAQPAPSIMMHASLLPNPDLPEYTFDPERAKQLLAESSWEEGRTLKFGRFTAQGAPDNIIVALINMWKDIGVNAEFTALDPATQVDVVRSEDHPYDVVLTSFAWLAYDPSSAYGSFACEQVPSWSNYCNDEFDEVMKEAIRTLDADAATELYQRAQTILQNDLPYAPVWIEPGIWAIDKGVHGGILGRGPLNDVLSELWWKE